MRTVIVVIALALSVITQPAASASTTNAGADTVGNSFRGWAEKDRQGTDRRATSRPSTPADADGQGADSDPREYEWRAGCQNGSGEAVAGASEPRCGNPCPLGEVQYRLWQTAPVERPVRVDCSGDGPPAIPGDLIVTPDLVLRAFREIPLPRLRSRTQPEDKTLVNFETIFYTETEPLTRTVTLLGQRVRLDIEPATFTWHHGDGTTTTTTTPGDRYPAKTIVHKYADAYTTFRHHLTVTWRADYSLNDGPTRPVPGTVTTTGAPTPLRVAEAVPTLSGAGQ